MAMIDACYLFSSKGEPRRAIVWGVYEMIHAEASWELDAEIGAQYGATPGEYIGFSDIDGNFRLFEIDTAENDDDRGITIISATDAAVAELEKRIVREIRLEKTTAETAVKAAVNTTGYALGSVTASSSRKRDVSAYFFTRWRVLRDIAETYDIRVIPRMTIGEDLKAVKTVDVLKRENVFRGRLIEGITDTRAIYVTKENAPITRMYAIGKPIGEEDPPSCVTIEDAEWSKKNGDPADKPEGQRYVMDEEAEAQYGRREAVYNDKDEENPEKLLEAAWKDLQQRKRPKVTGGATVTDLEMIDGYSHKKIRLYDKVYVRTRTGEDAEAAVVDVKRNYLRPSRTKIILGEEAASTSSAGKKKDLVSQVTGLTTNAARSGRSSAAAANRYIETKQLIQLNANTIQLNADEIVEINSDITKINSELTEIDGDLKVLGTLKADVAEIKSLLSGSSIVSSLSVTTLYINRRHVRSFTITIDGTEYHLFGYQ